MNFGSRREAEIDAYFETSSYNLPKNTFKGLNSITKRVKLD